MTDASNTPDQGQVSVLPGGRGGIHVRAFDSKAAAGAWVAGEILAALNAAIAERGKALWLGCGGTTPKPVYERLGEARIAWDRVQLAQVDERFVPIDDTRSNTRMMREALAPVLSEPVPGEGGGPGMELISLIEDITDQDNCAALAEATLLELGGGQAPTFDFALLGMGPDAHYASIFPNHAINAFVYATRALVLPVAPAEDGSEPVLPRITLSAPAINRSRRIVFFITGQAKLDILKTHGAISDPYASPVGAFLAQCPAPVEFVWAA
jgi:6-phosphogluconolactonase